MNKIISLLILGLFIALAACGNAKQEVATKEAEADQEMAEYVNPADEKLPFEIRDNVIFNENVPVVVDFYADWCNPCKKYAPTFHEVAEKYANSACFVSLNVDEYPALADSYEVKSIPCTVFIMPGGALLGKELGILSADNLETLVNQLIATSAGADMEI